MNTVILPVLNEPNLDQFTRKLYTVLEGIGEPFEVLVIMGDKEELRPELTPRPNQRIVTSYADSLERAILCGFSVANGSKLLVCDADGSHPLDKVPEMFNALEKYDMVVGSRFVDGSVFDQTPFRKMVSWFFIKLAHLCGCKLKDPMSGFFAIRKSVLDGIQYKPYHWKIALETAQKSKGSICEIPIHFNKRVSGTSKTTLTGGVFLIRDIVSGE